ncbi:glutamate ABC transporter substrate-binding protein [Microbacterium azadirachtae]|uniref:ABC transporter glutamine-binding protein GlnH n=1 Tax=Microbacterium azadirachtae TaxID=582680 RepID=A0A0F0KZ47_9MICO|nr:glutamate ABC transporter substrate-binding protein [Microbacterium azadirachtae]KJL26168.1 ABC transporter glutamine-binding protein GlnH precursor [Microbacterium azadirachtae]UXW87115.1 glutamate ABC transporter substrate-binding protein [Microbacterium azadirachtae]SDM25216.1 amino acid ABC transporter substrate-binding protein, PAAT family [Microbacterium azadirachtae]SEG49033.1 amino acid ABC transporter substrate-binding protein, PAAT family [Microbacterium azadirachtae]SEG50896.1 am
MRKSRILTGVGIAAVALIALTGCNSGSPTSPGATGEGVAPTSDKPLFEVAKDVKLEGSPTFDRITKNGKITVGVKEDQPGLGFKDATTGKRSGFDIDIARWIAASLGYSEDKIEFKPIPSANREQSIVNGDIDYYVGTYSITDKRKAVIDFAGPYFVTGQGLLVRKSEDTIKSEKDLAGKTVCSATGSTPLQNIQANFPDTKTVGLDLYSACVEQLINKQVDAVTTDQAILIGYASQDPEELKVVGEPFTTEKYGVGLAKGDTALQTFIDTMFTDGGDTWKAIFEKNLGASGMKVTQPAVEK